MSLLQISPINDDRLTCFERPLCAVANWLQRYNRTYESNRIFADRPH